MLMTVLTTVTLPKRVSARMDHDPRRYDVAPNRERENLVRNDLPVIVGHVDRILMSAALAGCRRFRRDSRWTSATRQAAPSGCPLLNQPTRFEELSAIVIGGLLNGSLDTHIQP
jgi:hypothetical protein